MSIILEHIWNVCPAVRGRTSELDRKSLWQPWWNWWILAQGDWQERRQIRGSWRLQSLYSALKEGQRTRWTGGDMVSSWFRWNRSTADWQLTEPDRSVSRFTGCSFMLCLLSMERKHHCVRCFHSFPINCRSHWQHISWIPVIHHSCKTADVSFGSPSHPCWDTVQHKTTS